MFRSDTTPSLPLLGGRANEFLSDKADLVALGMRADEDLLYKFLQHSWVFQKRKDSNPLDRTTFFKSHNVVRTVATIRMIIATLLLIGAILSLRVVSSSKAKFGMVSTYTLLFALGVATLTNARRAEVFAATATAAYAAVLVAFVSGNLGASRADQCLIQLENGYFRNIQFPDQGGVLPQRSDIANVLAEVPNSAEGH